MKPATEIKLEQLAGMSAEFLKTQYGEWIIEHLSKIYNALHHEAELVNTAEQKAMKVERAAGLRMAIDLLTNDAALLESGYFEKED